MKLLQIIKEEVVPLSRRQNVVLLLIIACIFQFALFFAPTLAEAAVKEAEASTLGAEDETISLNLAPKEEIIDQSVADLTKENASSSPAAKIKSESVHVITAYTSEAAQTDSSPCITANGFNVCEHGIEDTIAANWLPMGAKVKIPDLFGDRIFVVRDRMNKRHADRADIWMVSKADALKFGKKTARIQVIE
jgi:3D (Asp-Asp-Asp) domain-containing protein